MEGSCTTNIPTQTLWLVAALTAVTNLLICAYFLSRYCKKKSGRRATIFIVSGVLLLLTLATLVWRVHATL